MENQALVPSILTYQDAIQAIPGAVNHLLTLSPAQQQEWFLTTFANEFLTVCSTDRLKSDTLRDELISAMKAAKPTGATEIERRWKRLYNAVWNEIADEIEENTKVYENFQDLRDYIMLPDHQTKKVNAPSGDDYQKIIAQWVPDNFRVIRDIRNGGHTAMANIWLIPLKDGTPTEDLWISLDPKKIDLLTALSKFTGGWVTGLKHAQLLESTIRAVAFQIAENIKVEPRPVIITDEALYYHLGHQRVMRWGINADGTLDVQQRINGEDGVLFQPAPDWFHGATGERLWNYAGNPASEDVDAILAKLDTWLHTIAKSSLRPIDDSFLSSNDQLQVIRSWFVHHFARNRAHRQENSPILTFFGEPGSGKTTVARLLLILLTSAMEGTWADVTTVLNSGNSEEALQVLLTNDPLVVVDNLDQRVEFVPPMLESASTGGSVTKRQLYETNTMARFPIISSIVVTSANLSWLQGRQQTLERALLIRLRNRQDQYGVDPLNAEAWENQFGLILSMLMIATRRTFQQDVVIDHLPVRLNEWALTLYYTMRNGRDVQTTAERKAFDSEFAKLILAVYREQNATMAEYDRLVVAIANFEDGEYAPKDIYERIKADYEGHGEKFTFPNSETLMRTIWGRTQAVLAFGVKISQHRTGQGNHMKVERPNWNRLVARYVTHLSPADDEMSTADDGDLHGLFDENGELPF